MQEEGHLLEEEIQVEEVLDDEEHDAAIENAASLKQEIISFTKELSDLKKTKMGLSQANTFHREAALEQ